MPPRHISFPLIITLGICIVASANETTWMNTYGGSMEDWCFSIQQTTDNGYIMCGYTKSFGRGAEVWLVKIDETGDQEWDKTFGRFLGDCTFSVQQTEDDGYILTGYTENLPGFGWGGLWLIKTDENGDTLWTRIYGDGDWSPDVGFSVQQTTDGGYIVTGTTASFGPGKSSLWVLKTDARGDTLWTKTYGSNENDAGFHVQQTYDEGYIIVGFVETTWYPKNHHGEVQTEALSITTNSGDLWLLKTDDRGDTVWTKTFGGEYNDAGLSVQQTTDHGYIITGLTGISELPRGNWIDFISFAKSGKSPEQQHLFSNGTADLWLIKTDSLGNELWSHVYGGLKDDAGFSVEQTTDGGYIVGGFKGLIGYPRRDVMYHSENRTPFSSNLSDLADAWLIKTDAQGDTLWTRTYGGDKNDDCYCVRQTKDGGYILCGGTRSYGSGSEDALVIKTDSLGQIVEEPEFGDIELSNTTLFYGPVLVGDTVSLSLWIYNAGPGDLQLHSLSLTGDFTFKPAIPPVHSIVGGDSLEIAIMFTPTESGLREGTLTIHSDDPDDPQLIVSLRGTGYNALTITTTSLSEGTAGEPYTDSLDARGGIPPYTWDFSGTLPPGLIMDISNGTLSGVSTVADTYTFVAIVTDVGARPDTARRELSITIHPGQLSQVTVIPESVTLEPGQSQRFVASGYDDYDNTVVFEPLWEATGGSIDQNGLYTAGSEAGDFIVTARDPLTGIHDQALIHIVSTVVRGDVNCDGSITPGDALCAFWRAILGQFQEECLCDHSEQAAEVNCDGNITPGDALCIFWRAITGEWSEECRCEP